MARGKLKELIDYFELQEGWDKDEIISDYVASILKDVSPELLSADELTISDGEKDIMILSDFADKLFDEIIQGVCNVIATV